MKTYDDISQKDEIQKKVSLEDEKVEECEECMILGDKVGFIPQSRIPQDSSNSSVSSHSSHSSFLKDINFDTVFGNKENHIILVLYNNNINNFTSKEISSLLSNDVTTASSSNSIKGVPKSEYSNLQQRELKNLVDRKLLEEHDGKPIIYSVTPLLAIEATRLIEHAQKQKLSMEEHIQMVKEQMEERETREKRMEKLSIQLTELVDSQLLTQSHIILNHSEIDRFDADLGDYFLDHPEQAIEAFKDNFKGGDVQDFDVEIAGISLKETVDVPIGHIRTDDIGKLKRIEGIIKSTTAVVPKVVNITFSCPECGNEIEVAQDGQKIVKPKKCFLCAKPVSFKEVSRDCIDNQIINVQEEPGIWSSRQPDGIAVELEKFLTEPERFDKLTPGNKVGVVGWVKPIDNEGDVRLKKLFCANSIKVEDVYSKDIERITDADKEAFKLLSETPFILWKAFAPHVIVPDWIKKLLMFQMVGGVTKTGYKYSRGDVHVLFVGDPGTAKSELALEVVKVSPKARYTTGAGSSSAGLTAAVRKDETTGQWILEAGDMVLSSGGVLIVDEFDKMNSDDRNKIHEALEQQTVSVSKANIHATLRAQCAVMACANPKNGRYDPAVPVQDQLDIPPALFSRFDVVVPFVDIYNKGKDSLIADGIINSFTQRVKVELDRSLIQKYILYCRRLKPEFTDDAVSKAKDFFLTLRECTSHVGESKPVNPRVLNTILRLSEASARLGLRDSVLVGDVKNAIHLVTESYKALGLVNADTGSVNSLALEFAEVSKL